MLASATAVKRRRDERAEVSRGHSSRCARRRRPEHARQEGAEASMDEGDAARRAERPEDCQRVADGIRESTDRERQTSAAAEDTIPTETMMLLEEVLRRGNLLDAHGRVLSNGGAPGIDGMAVEALWPYLQKDWTRIREELQNGTYKPRYELLPDLVPVRRAS